MTFTWTVEVMFSQILGGENMMLGPISRMFSWTVSGFLGEVDREAGEQRAGQAHHLLPDPGQREEGDELVVFELRSTSIRFAAMHEEVSEREHRALSGSRWCRRYSR